MKDEPEKSIPFVPYEKIALSPDKWKLSMSDTRLLKKADWVVTEKIHGANFCVLTDGIVVRCAKRKALLEKNDDFFGFQRPLEKLHLPVRKLFSLLQEELPELRWLKVYGELFGGGYPHPEVPNIEGVQPIQTGVYYAPDIEFCAFDIAWIDAEGERRYLDLRKAISLFEQVGIFFTKPLFIGKYTEALAYPSSFVSTVSSELGLPPLSEENLAEGVVLKPVQPIEVVTSKGKCRPVLKNKIPTFTEDKRFHQAQKWSYQVKVVEKESAFEELQFAALSFATQQRLHNAISKIGQLDEPNSPRARECFQLFAKDIEEDLLEEYPALWDQLQEEELVSLRDDIREFAQEVLDGYFAQ